MFSYFYSGFYLEMILETSTHSTIERNIQNVIRQNFLEQRAITWKPIKVELIVNTQLTDDFFGKYFLFNSTSFSLAFSR
jgi:hypothetical protein